MPASLAAGYALADAGWDISVLGLPWQDSTVGRVRRANRQGITAKEAGAPCNSLSRYRLRNDLSTTSPMTFTGNRRAIHVDGDEREPLSAKTVAKPIIGRTGDILGQICFSTSSVTGRPGNGPYFAAPSGMPRAKLCPKGRQPVRKESSASPKQMPETIPKTRKQNGWRPPPNRITSSHRRIPPRLDDAEELVTVRSQRRSVPPLDHGMNPCHFAGFRTRRRLSARLGCRRKLTGLRSTFLENRWSGQRRFRPMPARAGMPAFN